MNERNKTLITLAQQGDKDKLAQIIEENKGLIWSIVKRFLGRGYEPEDLYQIACIGFIEAIQRFDFNYDVELSTYSVQYMIGEIKKFLRDDGLIRISRSVKELGMKIKELERIYMVKTGESLCIARLSEILELPEENIYIAMEAQKTIESINAKVGDDDREIIDLLIDDEDEQSKLVDKITIRELIKKLNLRDREIIKLRYFKDKTQSQVAKILGISQVHVSRIEKRILSEFKKNLLTT
jgi:RNA polymerase sporulation-specific sigma factor